MGLSWCKLQVNRSFRWSPILDHGYIDSQISTIDTYRFRNVVFNFVVLAFRYSYGRAIDDSQPSEYGACLVGVVVLKGHLELMQ